MKQSKHAWLEDTGGGSHCNVTISFVTIDTICAGVPIECNRKVNTIPNSLTHYRK